MKSYSLLLIGVIVLGMLAACAAPVTPGAQPDRTPAVEPTETPLFRVPEEAQGLIQSVREQLAARLDRAAESIDVFDVEAAEWPTAAMGCPEPDKMYAQVVTEGYIVRLKAGAETYEVHVSKDGNMVVCQGELPAIPAGARELVQDARSALAERLGQAGNAFDIIDVEAREWPTAAMGCPQPDTAYAQVVTTGYAVRLKMGDNVYEVHVSDDGQVVFCDAEEEQKGMQVPTSAQPAVNAAKQDLASRIDASVDTIEVIEFEAVDWRDSSLGCPEPGKSYLQVITPGYRVVLQADGQTYEYHTNREDRAVLCKGGTPASQSDK